MNSKKGSFIKGKGLCLDTSEEFLYDWTTSDKLEK